MKSKSNVNIQLNQKRQLDRYSLFQSISHLFSNGYIREAGDTPLHCAVAYKSDSVVRMLLKDGADVNVQNSVGFSPFFSVIAGLCQQELDVDEIPDTYLVLIKMLLESHANINIHWGIKNHVDYCKLNEGDTPLHCTMKYQCIPAQRLLLEIGADMNIPNCSGLSPLFQAVYDCRASNQYKISDHGMKSIQLLLKSKSSINVQLSLGSRQSFFNQYPLSLMIEGDTPLHCAVKYELIDIVQLLLHYSLDLFLCNSNHETASEIARQKYNEAMLVPDDIDKKNRLNNIIHCLEFYLR